MWQEFKDWLFYIVYTLDLLANAVVGGSPRETISSRCYRMNRLWQYRLLEIAINALAYPFDGKDHCMQSYHNIVSGKYLPDGFFDRAVYNRIMDEANTMNAAFDMEQV